MPDPNETHSVPLHVGTATAVATPSYAPPGSSPAPVFAAAPDRYILGDEIARGGMGAVHRATDTAFGREVAVKFLLPGHDAARFFDEARITGQLQHPGIPPIYDLGVLPDGRPFLAMKLIKGRTLADALKAGDRLNVPAVFEGICQALGYAHSHRVIHRDLKPANVMVGAHGEVQVMDWGLAKVLTALSREAEPSADTGAGTAIRTSRDESDATRAGSAMGTPQYMPPEQARGLVDEIDQRSDVFGLGGLLCAMLTGQPVYVGSSRLDTEIMATSAETAAAFERLDTCGADTGLMVLCKRCLSAKRADRPMDGNAVAAEVAALRAAAEERAKQAELDRVRADEEGKRQQQMLAAERSRQRLRTWAATVVGLVLAAGTGVSVWQAVRAGVEARRADDRTADAEREQKEAEQQKGLANVAAQKASAEAKRADERAAEAVREKEAAKTSDLAARRMVGRIATAEGLRLAENGDVSQAMAWFAQPLRVAPDDILNDLARERLANYCRYSCDLHLVGVADVPNLTPAETNRRVHGTWELRVENNFEQKLWSAQVWDSTTGRPATAPMKHDDSIRMATFDPEGRRVATASGDHTARVWDAQTGHPITPLLRHGAPVTFVRFSPDGRRVVTSSWDRTFRLWDAKSGRPITSPLPSYGNEPAAFSPDGRQLSVHGFWGEGGEPAVWVWDAGLVRSITRPLSHGNPVFTAKFSPDGKRVATLGSSKTVQIWDTKNGKPVALPLFHTSQARTAEFSPDGSRIAIACDDHKSYVWDVTTGRLVSKLEHPDGAWHPVFSPDGRQIFTSGDRARVWNTTTGQTSTPPLKNHFAIHWAEFSPDGRRVATITPSLRNWSVQVWDGATGQPITGEIEHIRDRPEAQFSPDSRLILTLCGDGTVRVWDACTGRAVSLLIHPDNNFNSASFSQDSRRVMTVSFKDSTARVWDAISGEPVTPPMRHTGLLSASFSLSGRRIVTAGQGKSARVWEANTGHPITPPLLHADSVNRAAFSPDERRLVTACQDGKARIWELPVIDRPLDDLVKFAHLAAGGEIDAGGGFIPHKEMQRHSLFIELCNKYPADFIVTPEQAAACHRDQLDAAEADQDWFAVAFHLRVLLDKYAPGDADLTRRLKDAEAKLHPRESAPPPRPAR